MRFLKLLIYGLFTLLILVFLIPFFLPAEVEISRQISIPAEARQVFRLVNDFENWKLWSPFELDKPEVEARITGPVSGEGSTLVYKSNTAGEGSITIIKSQPYSSIHMMLGMQKGGVAVDEWLFEPTGDSVLVTWTLKLSELSYPFHRYFGFFSRSLMTPFQQKGLEKLRELSMQMPRPLPVDTLDLEGIKAIVTPVEPDSYSQAQTYNMKAALVESYLSKLRIMPADGMLAVYSNWNTLPPSDPLVGFEVAEETRESGIFRYTEIPGGKAVVVTIVGRDTQRQKAYEELSLFMREFSFVPDSSRPVLELYSPASSENQVARFVVFVKAKNNPE
ncbi:MAG: SRPBCC family protein [Bacteroidetes bacterium]|nr:SRPBCC family protein [Bacteroidota bacterium]